MLNADRIVPLLWQGSDPPLGPTVKACGVDVLVLCARERQHSAKHFPGVEVIYAPMDDGEHVPIDLAMRTAQLAATRHIAGKRVLICCLAGLNRSGLVSALTLWYRYGSSGAACVRRVQERRPDALCNPTFTRFLEQLPPRRRLSPQ